MTAIATVLVAGGASAAMAQGQGTNTSGPMGGSSDLSVRPYVRQYLNTLDQQPDTEGIQNQAVRQGLGVSVRADDQQQALVGQGQQAQRGQAEQMQGRQALRDLPPGTVVYVVPQQGVDPGIHDPQSRMTMNQELPTQMTPGTMAVVPVPVGQGRQQVADQRMQGGRGLYTSRQSPGSAATPYERGYAEWRDQRLSEMDRSYQAWRDQAARRLDESFQARQQAMGQTSPARTRQDQQAQADAPDDGGIAYVTPQGNIIVDRMPDVPGIQVEIGR